METLRFLIFEKKIEKIKKKMSKNEKTQIIIEKKMFKFKKNTEFIEIKKFK